MEHVLRTPKLSSDSGIRDCSNAIQDLHYVMSQQLSQGVQIMQAVSDQKNYFSELSFNFGKKLKVCFIAKNFQKLIKKVSNNPCTCTAVLLYMYIVFHNNYIVFMYYWYISLITFPGHSPAVTIGTPVHLLHS